MRLPSIKTLSPIFPHDPKMARAILQMSREDFLKGPSCAAFDAVKAMIRTSYNPHFIKPYYLKMAALNALGGFYGVECIASTREEFADYLNTGDVYNPTIIFWRGRYRVQSLGDFIETMERQHIYFK